MVKKIIIAIVVVALVLLGRQYIDVDEFLMFIEGIRTNPLAPILFVIAYGVFVTFAIPASAFTLLSGSIFGLPLGLLLTILGSNLGCHLSYFLSKVVGKDAILKRIKSGSFLENAQKRASDNGLLFMFYVRLIPLFPFAAVNYLSGMIGIKYRDYTIGTVLGMLPASAVYTYIGFSAVNIADNPWLIVSAVLLLAILTAVIYLVKKKKPKDEEMNFDEAKQGL